MSFSLYAVNAEASVEKRQQPKPLPQVDATALHGRRGAQVALLQSPILPAVQTNITRISEAKPKGKTRISMAEKCNPCAREKMLPLYRNIHISPLPRVARRLATLG